jgi:actin, other eukaryote
MAEEEEQVIMDIGSGTLKAGVASDDEPKCKCPMLVGTPISTAAMVGMEVKDAYYCHEAVDKYKYLNITNPVQKGIVTDMDLLADILRKEVFSNQLRIDPAEHRMILSEPPVNSKKAREELVQILMEEFDVPKVYLGKQAVLALFATGRTTGTVLDSGHGSTHAVPIFEGYAIPHAVKTIDVSGNDLTDFLIRELNKNPDNTKHEVPDAYKHQLEIEVHIKEKRCYVAQDFDAELKQAQESANSMKEVTLPNNAKLVLRDELIRTPDVLFHPQFIDRKDEGIARATHECITSCDQDIRKDLFKNIVLAGGCTMF